MKKNRSNRAWIHEHINDPYVQRAQAEGYRSRAAFKLIEIDDQDRLLKPGSVVVDLGAAPGSWCQVVARRVGAAGKVLALDMLPMEPLAGVEFIQGDFREESVLAELESRLGDRAVDLVLSDMAPNLSGVAVSDQARMIHLAELTLDFAIAHLRTGGNMLVKLFHGPGFEQFRRPMADVFGSVAVRKPKASRDRSSEIYLLGLRKKPQSTVRAEA
ncbi:MAG: RlmE family RNA methyltransferase [Rhodocyclaceae bacterium]|jgi:23S rRNA (uridine2552-2'-O)-methyltransferase